MAMPKGTYLCRTRTQQRRQYPKSRQLEPPTNLTLRFRPRHPVLCQQRQRLPRLTSTRLCLSLLRISLKSSSSPRKPLNSKAKSVSYWTWTRHLSTARLRYDPVRYSADVPLIRKQILHQADFTIPVEIEGNYHNVYVIKRPGVDQFMKRVGELYEVVVFTASVSKVSLCPVAP